MPPSGPAEVVPAGVAIQAKAVRSAAWNIAASLIARATGLIGSIGLTFFIHPDVMGEVVAAVILVQTANALSLAGYGHYLVTRPDEGPNVTFHVTVLHALLGIAALAVLLALEGPLGSFFNVSGSSAYLPWLLVGMMCDRASYVPERLLIRRMSFRRVAFARSFGDVVFTASSMTMAIAGMGAFAVIFGNVIRSALRSAIYLTGVPPGDWLRPAPLTRAVYARILGFGLPIWLQSMLSFAAAKWDSLLFARLFGAGTMASYNYAYNLADLPADQIGEQVAEVLLPSFAQMAPAERDRAVVEVTGIFALVIFPLSIGLGAVATTLVDTLLRPEWHEIGTMLAFLSALSVARPLYWQAGAYFLATNRPRVGLVSDSIKLGTLIVGILVFGRFGPLWACGAVGLSFGLAVWVCWWIIAQMTGAKVRSFFFQCVPPLLACGVMVLAVLGVRHGLALSGVHIRGLGLGLEIVAGAIAYVGAALTIARGTSRRFLVLVRGARQRRAQVA